MIAKQPTHPKDSPTTAQRVVRPGPLLRLRLWTERHTRLTLGLISMVAAIISCYPVIFCNRSYVSPASVPSVAYDWWPPMPGMDPDTLKAPTHQSDTGAAMWWDVPVGFIQSRSLLDKGEIPLWNRYGHAGEPLLAQAVSMFGDPLHAVVIVGRGSALAWDIKYLIAKFVFCVGFGLLIRKLIRHQGLSWMYAALSAYCGAYFFIANHPVFFVFAYAPWILLAALKFLDLSGRFHVYWAGIWLIASFGCFNAGYVEGAVILIGGLNLAALAAILSTQSQTGAMLRVLGRMTLGTFLFLALSAPIWISFLTSLNGAYTAHQEINVTQQRLESVPGAFDASFFMGVGPAAPCSSLLVLAGVIISASRWRTSRRDPFFWVNSAAVILWGGCVFGWVPGSVLLKIPLLNRVGHVGRDFSYLLVVHLTIQSSYGFKALSLIDNTERRPQDLVLVFVIISGLLVKHLFLLTWQPEQWYYLLSAGLAAVGAPSLYRWLATRSVSIPLSGWAGVIALGFVAQARFGLYSFGNKSLLMLPGPRVCLNGRSRALETTASRRSDPFRVAAICGALSGNYSAVYGLEDIRSSAPLSNFEYIDLLRKSPGITLTADWVISVTNIQEAQNILSMLNVRYILADPQHPPETSSDFRVVERSDFLVLENSHAWPRAFFVNEVHEETSVEDFMHRLEKAKSPFVCLSREFMALHPELQHLKTESNSIVAPATRYELHANSTAFHVRAEAPGLVCLTETQAKDFTVSMNHKPRQVLTVNRAFKGVYVDAPGEYDIEFIYRPRYWFYSCCLFWISLTAGVALVGGSALRHRPGILAHNPYRKCNDRA